MGQTTLNERSRTVSTITVRTYRKKYPPKKKQILGYKLIVLGRGKHAIPYSTVSVQLLLGVLFFSVPYYLP